MIWCVEDDASIRDIELYALTSTGFEARGFDDGASFWEALQTETPELVLLDVMLPGEDGVSLLKKMKAAPALRDIPVIMATAKGAEYDKIQSLDLGADDYLVKPFSLRELAARIEALLRRAYGAEQAIVRVGALEMNCETMRVIRAGCVIELNPTCLKILKTLMLASPNVVSRERLESVVWSGSAAPASDSLRSNLYLLRQAIDKPFGTELIKTHPRLGWSISAEAPGRQ